MPNSPLARRTRRTILLLALSLPVAATGAERQGAGVPDPADPAVAPRPAVVAVPEAPRPVSRLRLRVRPAADPVKAEVFVDDGLERPVLEPTARERAKLEAARVAVEASRAAGTLDGAFERAPRSPLPPWQVEAAKFERLRASRPAPITSRPEEMGLGAASRQKQGPAGLTPAEQAKRDAKPASSVTPESAKEGSR